MKLLLRYTAMMVLAFAAFSTAAMASDDSIQQVDWSKTPVRLLMVDQEGCIYCARWDQEIGTGYPKSSEGRAAPLLRVDIKGPWPDGIVLDRNPTITPTFILLRNGTEVARLEGYPGDQYFYALIDDMLAKLDG